jgi:hypothetical protein
VKEYSRTARLYDTLMACPFSAVPVSFDAMCVMESTLTPKGAIHTELGRLDLPRE